MRVAVISHSNVVPLYRKKFLYASLNGNCEVRVFVPHKWNEAGRDVFAKDENQGSFSVRRMRIFGVKRWWRYFAPLLLWHLYKFNPDILHAEEEPWSVTAFMTALYAKFFSKPMIFFTWENIQEKAKFPYSVFERFVLKTARVAIAGNEEAKQILKRKNAQTVYVIPQMGVELNGSCGKESAFTEGTGKRIITVGYVGRVIKEKGIETLIEAVSKTNTKIKLLIVGSGEMQGYVEEFKKNCAHEVEITGSVPHEKVADYLKRMDVLVLPSRTTPHWKEQFGRVIIEAMACGVAVIGSDSGAIPEVIGDAGMVFKEGNADDLRDKIEGLVNDDGLLKEFIAKARQRVAENYTNKVIADRIYEIYKDLIV